MPRNVTSLSMRNINEKCMINIINYKHKKRLIIIIIDRIEASVYRKVLVVCNMISNKVILNT